MLQLARMMLLYHPDLAFARTVPAVELWVSFTIAYNLLLPILFLNYCVASLAFYMLSCASSYLCIVGSATLLLLTGHPAEQKEAERAHTLTHPATAAAAVAALCGCSSISSSKAFARGSSSSTAGVAAPLGHWLTATAAAAAAEVPAAWCVDEGPTNCVSYAAVLALQQGCGVA